MAPASSNATSAQSLLVLQRLRQLCTESLRQSIPERDSTIRALWNDDIIQTLTAVLELQRVELELRRSEVDLQRLDIRLVARIIETVATQTSFPNERLPDLPIEMEPHLRLLAAALRLYKYNGTCLDDDVHTAVYNGITKFSDMFKSYRNKRHEKVRVDDSNVNFLLIHCQYLLLSIDSSESLSQKIAKRAVDGFDIAMMGLARSFHNIRPTVMEIIKRKRTRGKWHDTFLELEDACWMVVCGDIQSLSPAGSRDSGIDAVLEEASIATDLLMDNMTFHSSRPRKSGLVTRLVKRAAIRTSEAVQESGPAEEHEEYLRYGILDLVYQLSFRIRQRSREECFKTFLKIVRMVLERSPSSVNLSSTDADLYLKATDLWNRICEVGSVDGVDYGEDEDRVGISIWTGKHIDYAETWFEYSKLYDCNLWRLLTSFRRSKRVQSQIKMLRKKEKSLIRQAYCKETRFARTDYQDEAGRNEEVIVGSPNLDRHFFFNHENRLTLLHHLCRSEDVQFSDVEIELLVQLVQRQPTLRRRIENVLHPPDPSNDNPHDDDLLDVHDNAQGNRVLENESVHPTSPVDVESVVAAMERPSNQGLNFPATDRTRIEPTSSLGIVVATPSIMETDQTRPLSNNERRSRGSTFCCMCYG
jgi:hypothetical protein